MRHLYYYIEMICQINVGPFYISRLKLLDIKVDLLEISVYFVTFSNFPKILQKP